MKKFESLLKSEVKKAAKMYVTYKIEGRFYAAVDADSIEEAKEKAEEAFSWANFGDLDEIVDSEPIIVEDDKYNIVWEK
jgi:adenylyl- and sulfurtransferase ThiI